MKHLLGVVTACTGVAVAILLLSSTTYFSQLNSTAYDFTLRLAGTVAPTSPTMIVAIDEESLERIGPWPWPRNTLAQLIERVETGSPRALAIDIVLDESTTPEADEALAATLSRVPKNIVLAARLVETGDSSAWRKPNPMFLTSAVTLGHVHAEPDFDGTSRRVFSAKIGEGLTISAFSIEALRTAGFPVAGDFEQQIGTARVIRPQPIRIRYVGGRQSFPQIAAWRVIEGDVAPETFTGRIVLVGSTADGLQDQWFTPFSLELGQKMSGVEIHANAIDTLYSNRAIQEFSELTGFGAVALLALLLWWVDRRFEGWRAYAFALAVLPATVALSWLLLKYADTWLPFPPLWAALVLVVPGLEVRKLVRVNRDLDGKIEKLSGWNAALQPEPRPWSPKDRIEREVPAGPDRDNWLALFEATEQADHTRQSSRNRLLTTTHRNARWRLSAVDFFNEDLVRFLSFNNAILASIEDVIIVADPLGRVVFQNPAARRLDGYHADPPFAPDYFATLMQGQNFVASFAGVLSRLEPLVLKSVESRAGHRFYNVSLAPVARLGVVLSMHDATAQHDLTQAKNDMVSLVSHELRTPLTSIRGYSEMLVKYDLVQEKGKPFLSTIIAESQRLNGLIQSFLDIAYIESGRQELTRTVFDIAPVIRDMLAALEPVAVAKQIRIEPSLASETLRVGADRLLLYQALSNLVTNAIKYSPEGSRVDFRVLNGNGRVRFEVSDEGCGIPAEELTKVFEKFYRRTNRETVEQAGFGLGLAFVKEVANFHGGDVIVESEVGRGSRFTLWIPNEA